MFSPGSMIAFLLILVAFDFSKAQSNSPYCKVCSDHTMCLYSSANSLGECGQLMNGRMSQAEKNQMLALHNQRRQKVASGQQNGQPGATDMKTMVWSTELEKIAQRYADQCHWGHDKCRKTLQSIDGTNSVGQNIWQTQGITSLAGTIEGPMKSWFDGEVDSFRGQSTDRYVFKASYGHYTQIVWSRTNRLGCARSFYKPRNGQNTAYVVCNYGPAGNIINSYVYKKK